MTKQQSTLHVSSINCELTDITVDHNKYQENYLKYMREGYSYQSMATTSKNSD